MGKNSTLKKVIKNASKKEPVKGITSEQERQAKRIYSDLVTRQAEKELAKKQEKEAEKSTNELSAKKAEIEKALEKSQERWKKASKQFSDAETSLQDLAKRHCYDPDTGKYSTTPLKTKLIDAGCWPVSTTGNNKGKPLGLTALAKSTDKEEQILGRAFKSLATAISRLNSQPTKTEHVSATVPPTPASDPTPVIAKPATSTPAAPATSAATKPTPATPAAAKPAAPATPTAKPAAVRPVKSATTSEELVDDVYNGIDQLAKVDQIKVIEKIMDNSVLRAMVEKLQAEEKLAASQKIRKVA